MLGQGEINYENYKLPGRRQYLLHGMVKLGNILYLYSEKRKMHGFIIYLMPICWYILLNYLIFCRVVAREMFNALDILRRIIESIMLYYKFSVLLKQSNSYLILSWIEIGGVCPPPQHCPLRELVQLFQQILHSQIIRKSFFYAFTNTLYNTF